MTNTELRKEAEKYIEENNIVSNTYEIEKAFIDGAKFLRDKVEVNNGILDDVIVCEHRQRWRTLQEDGSIKNVCCKCSKEFS